MSDAPLELQLATAQQELANVYRERAHLVALLAALYPASIGRTDPDTPDWPVVTLDTPAGQMSWHIAPDDVELFHHLDPDAGQFGWDGHSTEEKYARVRELTACIWNERSTPTPSEPDEPAPPVQEALTASQEPAEPAPAPKRRGRPRKTAQAPAQAAGDTPEA